MNSLQRYRQTAFWKSVAEARQLPPDQGREIALAGRSIADHLTPLAFGGDQIFQKRAFGFFDPLGKGEIRGHIIQPAHRLQGSHVCHSRADPQRFIVCLFHCVYPTVTDVIVDQHEKN